MAQLVRLAATWGPVLAWGTAVAAVAVLLPPVLGWRLLVGAAGGRAKRRAADLRRGAAGELLRLHPGAPGRLPPPHRGRVSMLSN